MYLKRGINIRRSYVMIFFLFLSMPVLAAERVSFKDFSAAVEENSMKMSSLRDESRGANFETNQGKFLTTPQAFVDLESSKDKSPVLTPEFSGTERNGEEIRLGVQSQTAFGLKPRIYTFTQNQNVSNVSSLPNPNLRLQRKGYGLEGEISLWKNAFGKDVRGQRDSLTALSESKLHSAEASRVSLNVEAHTLYFDSSFLKEAILIQEELIRQGERLVAWTKTQSDNRLLEPVHVAQAMASHQSRKLALITLTQQLASNLFKMSQLSGREISKTTELDSMDAILQNFTNAQKANGQKLTIKALAKAIESEKISLELAKENFKPDLSLKAQYLTFTNDGKNDDTARCRGLEDCRTLNVSLNFTFPLDVPTQSTGSAAAQARMKALEKDFAAELQNSRVELLQLEEQSKAFKDQIDSLKVLISAEETRLKKERERQARGRATTFDLILAEQDLGESKINLAEAKMRYVSAVSQFKLFEEGK